MPAAAAAWMVQCVVTEQQRTLAPLMSSVDLSKAIGYNLRRYLFRQKERQVFVTYCTHNLLCSISQAISYIALVFGWI